MVRVHVQPRVHPVIFERELGSLAFENSHAYHARSKTTDPPAVFSAGMGLLARAS